MRRRGDKKLGKERREVGWIGDKMDTRGDRRISD